MGVEVVGVCVGDDGEGNEEIRDVVVKCVLVDAVGEGRSDA